MINSKKSLRYLILLSALLGGSIILIKYCSIKPSQELNGITTHLDNIQTQLEILQQNANKSSNKMDTNEINQDFNKLTALIEQIKSNDEFTINQLMNQSRTELTQKLDAIHTIITSLDNKQHPIKYLPITSLPFKVISIDSIQQSSVATVTYNFKTIALEKNDKLAGWRILHIDFGQQSMELENNQKERVKVNMLAKQGEADV